MNDTEKLIQHNDSVATTMQTMSALATSPKRVKIEVDKDATHVASVSQCNEDDVSLVDAMLGREVAFLNEACKTCDGIGVQALPTIVVDYNFISLLAARVYETHGPGFSESMYQKALSQDLSEYHIEHEMEQIIPVIYKETAIGAVRADIVVQKKMVIELKRVARITSVHLQQAEMYARLLHLSEIIVINFPCQANTAVEVSVFRNDQTWGSVIH